VSSQALGQRVSAVLQLGTGLSAAVIAVGVVFGAPGIALAGMFVLTLTPVVELATAAATFARDGELRYALIASAACALLIGALLLAVALVGGVGG
jgi:uncharacterized membrane protein